jgi:DNA adenine methylase
MNKTKKSDPFVKWAGGKRKLVSTICNMMPEEFNDYYEPFIGGGALFFTMKLLYPEKKMTINDSNEDLINVYQVIKDNPVELMALINNKYKKYRSISEEFYRIRDMDKDIEKYSQLSDVEKAARFLFLNKTCFNGVYRVNKKGLFNVPFGKYEDPTIFKKENIVNVHCDLKDTTLMSDDFDAIKSSIKEGDLVYLDPPYVPVSKTSSFTAYTKDGFDETLQHRLRELCDYIDQQGAYFIASNSSADLVYELYSERYNIHEVHASRMINSNGDKRGKVKECIITNYETKFND